MVSELISVDSATAFALAIRGLIKCVICVIFFFCACLLASSSKVSVERVHVEPGGCVVL